MQVGINNPDAVVQDSSGNLYVAATGADQIYKIDKAGTVTVVAGNGTAGFSGDGGAAIAAQLNGPTDVFVDNSGNIFIADANNNRIREVFAASGIIQTVAGSGAATPYSPDGTSATATNLANPIGVAVNGSGNIFIAESNGCRVREVVAGNIKTVAGTPGSGTPGTVGTSTPPTGNCGYSGDGGSAVSAQLNFPSAVVLDTLGNLYIADQANVCVREVTTNGVIMDVAGTCTVVGSGGDGGAPTSALFERPVRLFVDSGGDIFISDIAANRIREVITAKETIQTVAGNGTAGFAGDGGPATQAELNEPSGVWVDGSGNIFLTDVLNNRVREVVASTGDIQTIAGNGGTVGPGGDGDPATSATLNYPAGVAVDGSGNIFISDGDNNRIRKVVAATGDIQTVAGTGVQGSGGNSGPATSAELNGPYGVFVDGSGNIFIADANNNEIREVVAATGNIQTVAGSGPSNTGYGGPALNALLNRPIGVFVDSSGNIFIADGFNNRIREVVAATGNIQTVAGNGAGGFSGDGGPAVNAGLSSRGGIFLDSSGNIFIADTLNNRVREVVAATGNIQTVAGNGTGGFSGDGGLATSAELDGPTAVFVDRSGYIFITDFYNQRIREVIAATGNIQAVAGNGTGGFSGDGGPPTSAELDSPLSLFGDQLSNLFIADTGNNRIRKITGLVTSSPANISASGGTPQSVPVNTTFQSPLLATVTDASGNLVGGVVVTFTAPTTGASGTFSDGVNTATTSAAGVATSTGFTANCAAGSYTVTATVTGVATPAAFSLTNTPGAPASITATSGSPQSTTINTVFANPLVATVKDACGNPVPGVNVTFTAPASGASGTFVGGSATAIIATNAQGIATAPAFTANSAQGSYNVAATVTGVATPANFTLTNVPPARITATGGAPQSTTINSVFPSLLAATVKDAGGNPVPGVNVTFTAPASGASGTFVGGSATATAGTNAQGIATAPAFTANSTSGSYNVTATVAGVATPASFSLTNLPAASITATSGSPQSATVNTMFANPLVATVKDANGNAVPGANVTFTAPAIGASGTFVGGSATATAATNAQGIATAPAFTANSTSGSYNVTATVVGVATPATFSLTNLPAALRVTTTSLPGGQVGVGYSQTLGATGGTTPYTWSTTTGTLPAGLTLNATTGAISGNPTTAGTSNFTAKVTDSETPAVSQTMSLSISISGNLATLQVLPQPTTVGFSASSVQFFAQDANGNPIPVIWSVSPATGAGTIIAATGVYTPPPSAAGTTKVTVTATAVADPTKQSSVNFTLASNGLSACCQLPQQLTVGVGATSQPTGVQLNGVVNTNTSPFTLSCSGLPVGAACAFTLPHSSTAIQSISGNSPTAFCYVITTGPSGTTTAIEVPSLPPTIPLPNRHFHAIVTFSVGLLALLLSFARRIKATPRRKLALMTLGLVCVTGVTLGACNGFSPANVPPPHAQVTPAGAYQIQILATPQPGSGFVQTQLIVPLTVN